MRSHDAVRYDAWNLSDGDARPRGIRDRDSALHTDRAVHHGSLGPADSRDLRVFPFDVIVDNLTELGGKLIVRAAQRFHVVAIDVNRAAGLFARTRQADADVRRLRLAWTIHDAPHDSERHILHALVANFPRRHHLANVILRALRQFLKRRARRPAASRAGGEIGR